MVSRSINQQQIDIVDMSRDSSSVRISDFADDLYTVFFFNLHKYNKQPHFVPKIYSIQFRSCNSSTFIHSIAVSSSYRHEMQFQDQRTLSEFLLHSISIVPNEMCFNDVRKMVSRVGTAWLTGVYVHTKAWLYKSLFYFYFFTINIKRIEIRPK